jgi:hypothetical protein
VLDALVNGIAAGWNCAIGTVRLVGLPLYVSLVGSLLLVLAVFGIRRLPGFDKDGRL